MTKAKTHRIGADLIEAMTEAVAHAKGRRRGLKEHRFAPEDVRLVRAKMDMTQAEFAATFHLTLRTLQKWESGERRPTGPAATLLQVIRAEPRAVRRALSVRDTLAGD